MWGGQRGHTYKRKRQQRNLGKDGLFRLGLRLTLPKGNINKSQVAMAIPARHHRRREREREREEYKII